MHQRSAMQEFERGAGRFRRPGMILAASKGDAVYKTRTHPRAFREHRITHRFGKTRWTAWDIGQCDGFVESAFNTTGDIHVPTPVVALHDARIRLSI